MDGYTIGFLITIAIGGFVIFKFLRLMKASGAEWRNTSMEPNGDRDRGDLIFDPMHSGLPGNIFHHDD